MATLRDIRRRISSVNNTRQITNAMKMLSTAKLTRAQNNVRAAQPYAEQLRHMVTSMARGLSPEDHPLLRGQEGGASVVLVFTSDRGLCGGFNAQVSRRLEEEITGTENIPEPELFCFGRVGNDFFRKRGYHIARSVIYAREPERVAALREVVPEVIGRFTEGEVGRMYVAYNRFENAVTQRPQVLQVLPVEPPETAEDDEPADEREILFEPSREGVLDSLLPKYVENQCFLAHLNTEAGEHGARMVAMDGATRSATDMIRSLTLQYNRARQAAITKELTEIVNAVEAV